MLTFLYKMCFHYISLFFLVLSDFASKIPAVFVLFICPLHCYFFTLLPTRRCWRFAGCTGLCFPTITNVTRFSATWFFFFLNLCFALMPFFHSAWAKVVTVPVRDAAWSQGRPHQRWAECCGCFHDLAEALWPSLHPTQRSTQTRVAQGYKRSNSYQARKMASVAVQQNIKNISFCELIDVSQLVNTW